MNRILKTNDKLISEYFVMSRNVLFKLQKYKTSFTRKQDFMLLSNVETDLKNTSFSVRTKCTQYQNSKWCLLDKLDQLKIPTSSFYFCPQLNIFAKSNSTPFSLVTSGHKVHVLYLEKYLPQKVPWNLHATSLTYSQIRFFRGRPKREEANSNNELVENLQPDAGSFEKDLVEFDQELMESRRGHLPASVNEMTLPELSKHAKNLVPYVSRSETLQNLVRLGVNLDLVQREEGIAELLLKSKFERDIAPLIHLLHMMGVPADGMGGMLTRNPLLFTQSIEDLSARFGYLLHYGFRQKDAASIVMRAPVTLLLDPAKLDSKLIFLKTTFGLSGQELEQVVLKYPKLLPWRRDLIANVRFHLKDFLSFSDKDMKVLIMKEPKIFMSSPRHVTESFEYLYNTMNISREQIFLWPGILRTRLHIVKGRHLFLSSRGQAQYDPSVENYVSMKAIAAGSDLEFCRHVAKCDERELLNFLKTL